LKVKVLLELGLGSGDDERSGIEAVRAVVGVSEHGLVGAPESGRERLVFGKQLLLGVLEEFPLLSFVLEAIEGV